MLTRWSADRVALYKEYMRTTSPCIPWFPKAAAAASSAVGTKAKGARAKPDTRQGQA